MHESIVRNLWDESTGPGTYRLTWDGRNSDGNIVSSGIFFCRLTINDAETMTRKLVLLR
jgi:hypothetical protein